MKLPELRFAHELDLCQFWADQRTLKQGTSKAFVGNGLFKDANKERCQKSQSDRPLMFMKIE